MVRSLLGILLLGISAAPSQAAEHWTPAPGASFSIILSVAPAQVVTPAEVVDLDLFDTEKSVVTSLKQQGKRVVCYFSAGSWENWRPDKSEFPASVKGKPLDGWPGERYLDIRNLDVLGPIMQARLDRCRDKGFDGADPDNVDSYEIGNRTGFPLARADAIAYLRLLAREAHRRGLAIGLKNATEIAPKLMSVLDFAVTEDCFAQGWCAVSKNFITAGKPVFAIEYTDNHIDFARFCAQANRLGLSPLLKRRNLAEWERRCP
jgi:hypothetical protein